MKKWSRLLLPCIIALQVLGALYFGGQKAGFHEDEYYSYYSSNRTAGFYYDDRTWAEMADWRKEFSVEKGSGFDFGMVHLSQSWDVHPPLYYDILHLVCSLTPGIFSKWQGIGINIAAFILAQLVLYRLTLRLAGGRICALAAVALWGFSPAAMSMLMFIRMYALLTLFVLLCAILHLGEKQDLKTSVLMGLVTLAGFLTHYYYIVFLVFLGLLKAASFMKSRRFKELAAYILCHGAALIAYFAVITKTALQLGASSVRYILPVCPLFIMLFVLAAGRLAAGMRPAGNFSAAGLFIALAVCAAVFAGNLTGLFGGRVLFLYTEEKEETAYAANAAAEGIPAAVIFNPASPYNMLRTANQLLAFDRIYLIDPENTEPVDEAAFKDADSFLVYSADDTGGEDTIRELFGRSSAEQLWKRDMYTVFCVR